MKHIIILTGVSTVGKSTLGDILFSKIFLGTAYIIPQYTSRRQREDDNPNWIQHCSINDFKKLDFLVRNNAYGILTQDLINFMRSDKSIALTVCGAEEITAFPKKGIVNNQSFITIKVLLRMTNDLILENKILSRQLEKYFHEEEYQFRLKASTMLNTSYFFNLQFLKGINMILTREESIDIWIKKISEVLPYNSISILAHAEEYLQYIKSTALRERTITLIGHGNKEGYNQSISARM